MHEVPFLSLPPGEGAADEPAGPAAGELERLRRLVLEGRPESAAEGYLARFASPEEQWSRLDGARRSLLVQNARAWADEAGDPEASRPSEELFGVAVPVLLTSGGSSPARVGHIQEVLAARLPNATAVRLPEGGHFLHQTEPDLFAGLLGSFLLERNVPTT